MGRGSSGSGSRSGGARVPNVTYERIPYSVLVRGAKNSSKEDAKTARAIVSKFMENAKAGDVYSTGPSLGSVGSQFEVVDYRRSPNGLGLKWIDSNRQPVAMSRSNVQDYLKNGAKLVRRNK